MSKIQIRHAGTGDEKILAEIQTASWKDAFAEILSQEELERYTDIQATTEIYTQVLRHSIANGSILYIDEKPHGFAFWGEGRESPNTNTAELICIHSLRDNWGKGYGSVLMQHVLDEIGKAGYTSVILWVFAENVRARRFYEKQGFALTDKTKADYGAVEVMYTKHLKTICQKTI